MLEPFAFVLGKILEVIYNFFAMFSDSGLANIGLCIIVFTFVVRMLMLPMTIKQQKFTKLNGVMTPEIQAIQKKYKDRRDQQSQFEQQEEIRAVYDKYGTSPTGGCLQLLIQLPILWAIYQVVRDIPKYVEPVANATEAQLAEINKFFVYDLNLAPSQMKDLGIVLVWLIPVLSGVFQFLSVQLSTKLNNTNTKDNPMAGSMKIMNFMMPLMSVYMCYILPTGLGLYWVAGSLIMMLQQVIVNLLLKNIDVNDIIEQNKEKAINKAEKRKQKQGIYREKVLEASKVNARNISGNSEMSAAEKEERIRKAKEAMNNKQGSLASKANMVSEYNKRSEK